MLLGLVGVAATGSVCAQAPSKVHRIAFLGVGREPAYRYRIAALHQGLRELGYEEGRNLLVAYGWAEGQYNRLPQVAAELAHAKPQVVVTHTANGVRAAQTAFPALPVVMTDTFDAVRVGLVQSLARPGGNVTGSTLLGFELNTKRLELLKELLPSISRIAVLLNPEVPSYSMIKADMAEVARRKGVDMLAFDVRQPEHFAAAFDGMVARQAHAVMVVEDPLFTVNTRPIAALARNHRLPLAGFTEFAESGGLIGYGVNFPQLYYRAAYFIDRILRGFKAADLPVEQATKFDLVLNVNTAKALGISIPQSLAVRAEKLIE